MSDLMGFSAVSHCLQEVCLDTPVISYYCRLNRLRNLKAFGEHAQILFEDRISDEKSGVDGGGWSNCIK